jgi:murein L,D-transpeptidase YcbB/YkuD
VFQARHGLTADGTIGKKTIDALNIPVERRIEQMAMNLERRRWLPDNLGERYVFVNMADFELKVVDGSRTIHTARVVVGTPLHRTPVFSDSIKSIDLNPFWNVTPSIATKELLPKIRRDPGYLQRNGYRLFSGWGAEARELDPFLIEWSSVSAARFAYKIRQDPGPTNALGQIKFVFPNTQNIYLHDTPSRQLFRQSMRAFSHGCIRVENPLALAVVLLEDANGRTKEKLTQIISSGEQRTLTLPRPIPVHLVYLTAWVNKDGSVNFRDDIYGRDNRLAEGLRRARHMING